MNERLSLCMTPTRSRSRGIFWGANVPGSHREAYVCSFYRSRSLCGGGGGELSPVGAAKPTSTLQFL